MRMFAFALVLITLAPGTTLAHEDEMTSVVSATMPGPLAPFTFASATTAQCKRNQTLIGGGALEAGSTSNGLHLNASIPSDSTPTAWIATGATGSQAAAGATTTAFGICLEDGPKHVRVVESSVSGPETPDTWTRTTATCPEHYVVVGGGARTEPQTVGSLKPIGSFPSDVSGNPVSNLSSDATAWTAVGLNGGQQAPGATTHAFAVCTRAPPLDPGGIGSGRWPYNCRYVDVPDGRMSGTRERPAGRRNPRHRYRWWYPANWRASARHVPERLQRQSSHVGRAGRLGGGGPDWRPACAKHVDWRYSHSAHDPATTAKPRTTEFARPRSLAAESVVSKRYEDWDRPLRGHTWASQRHSLAFGRGWNGLNGIARISVSIAWSVSKTASRYAHCRSFSCAAAARISRGAGES
jgi:hypothetical protein